MTYELVDVGAAPDDGNGDPLRTAYIKINNNFINLSQVGTTKISNGSSNVNIPYAVLETNSGTVKSFKEKPTYTYYSMEVFI